MDRDEAIRQMEERFARDHAARNEALWAEGKVTLQLVRSSDDPEVFSKEYQDELRDLYGKIIDADIDASPRILALDSAESFGGQLGEFVIPIAKYGFPALSGIVIGWLKGRSGREAKVEFFSNGNPKLIKGSTSEEVILMLNSVSKEAERKSK